MMGLFQTYKRAFIAIAFVVIAALSSVIVVPETEQAVVIRTGDPIYAINPYRDKQVFGATAAGVHFRIPFVDRVERIDKRVRDLDMQPQRVLSTDQRPLEVDAYARYRVVDPIKMVRASGNVAAVETQLSVILSSVVRQELGRHSFASLLTAERGSTMQNIRKLLDAQAAEYGVDVIDVRIKRADLPTGSPLQSAFARMRAAREQEAATIRAQGLRDAQIIRAEADAEAARIYAESFGKDPQFYDFYRAMQSYDTTFGAGDSESSIILSSDNEYLKQFRGNR